MDLASHPRIFFYSVQRMNLSDLCLSPGKLGSILGIIVALAVVTSAASADEPQVAPAARMPIDFAHKIVPLLQKRCAKCHAGTQRKGGYSINTRQSLIAGGDGGAAVVLRKSDESDLIERVSSDDSALRMPPEGEKLTREQVDLLKRWIDSDLSWDEGFVFGKIAGQAALAPRHPSLPADKDSAAWSNPVDRFLQGYFTAHQLPDSPVVSDQVFARRASFDLVGLAPSPADLDALAADPHADRRERFVDRLLGDKPAYAAHWLTFWNDLLRNAYHGTGFIDGGRRQITGWLYGALYDNMPYDQFVRELINPPAKGGSDGFVYGIKWRGTVNESQRREIQASQSVAQVFLGTNLKCASCHDSFVNHWKLADAYALASVFADGNLELHRCDRPTGVPAAVGFLYPELGKIDEKAPRAERMRQLAELLLHPGNGRTARTIVNRLWARLFGRGLVEPVDNMDAEPWHQDLLDYLASDLADHGYDLKRTLRLLATSHAYQLPGVGLDANANNSENFVFCGPFVKRLTAEQFVDTVSELTEAWPTCDSGLLKRDGRAQGGQLGDVARALCHANRQNLSAELRPLKAARWLWSHEGANQEAKPQTLFLRRVWQLAERPALATATVSGDDLFELIVNGKVVGRSANTRTGVIQVDVTDTLTTGRNVIGLKVTNAGDAPNPAGVIGEIFTLGTDGRRAAVLETDAAWRVSPTDDRDWLKPEFDDSAWTSAADLGDSATAPWGLSARLETGEAGVADYMVLPEGFRIRAALMPLDSLQSALGRPNREQLVSTRDTVPTMLQALQLTNGVPFGRLLARGAAHWHQETGADTKILLERLCKRALSRPPTDDERRLAVEAFGASPDVDAIEDLLWTITMLPEFQLVP
jgi:hypothetical protein